MKRRAPEWPSLTEATLAGSRAEGATRRREGRREAGRYTVRRDMPGTSAKAATVAMDAAVGITEDVNVRDGRGSPLCY